MVNSRIMKYAQLYSESILFSFLLIPIFVMAQFQQPFWSYLLITGFCIFLFDMGLWVVRNYTVYIFAAILMFCLMHYMLNYPSVIVLLWIGFMVWRHAHFIRNEPYDNQITILLLTMLMLLIGIIFSNHPYLIWLATLQMVIILCAYWYRQIIKAETNNMPFETTITLSAFVLLILIGGGVTYGIHPFLTNLTAFVFSSIGVLFEYTVFGTAGIADILGIDFRSLKKMVDGEAVKEAANKLGESMDRPNGQKETDNRNTNSLKIFNWWTASLALTVFIFLIAYFSRKKFVANSQAKQNKNHLEAVSVSPIKSSNSARKYTLQNKQSNNSSNDPIRKKMFKFEQLANTKGWGRKPSETIEEWLYRLEFSPYQLDIYQKVRYGEKNITKEERDSIYHLLDSFMLKMK